MPVLERPAVQRQLLAFLLIVLTAWLVPARVLPLAESAGRRQPRPSTEKERTLLRWRRALSKTVSPFLAIGLGLLALWIFDVNGWLTGLLRQLLSFFWMLLAYRLLVALFYVALRQERARWFSERLLKPLFIFILIVGGVRLLSGIVSLNEIALLTFETNVVTTGSLFVAAVVFYLFLLASWLARDALDSFVLPRLRSDPGIDNTIRTVTQYVLISLGVLTSLATLGIDLSTLAIIGAGLSVGIGFGLQELVGNFVSGILLLFEQSIRPGDWIDINNTLGKVENLRIRSTTIRTLDNVEIVVPNQTLLTSSVTTYTHSDRMVRIWIGVGVSYDAEPQQVRELLLAAASRHGLVRKEPKPVVNFKDFGESSLDFEVAVWVDNAQVIRQVRSDLRYMIWDQLKKNNIEIPFPQRDLHVRSGIPWEQLAPPAEAGASTNGSNGAHHIAPLVEAQTAEETEDVGKSFFARETPPKKRSVAKQ